MALPIVLAYIDPVSGSILLQVILAAIIGSVTFFYRSIGRCFRAVLRLPRSRGKGSE